ncbi:DgyrCDS10281 [Dimorphilus gyrociliatus]|uniref:DgyrCDS10281 n=1 Tax=Dimorphilus gyrociliatus TaxID=2664684 RepID=A0A7I8VZR6_9ANNE|nr:DgyrCDS10281 [Dimorphilus gyrociliatus]
MIKGIGPSTFKQIAGFIRVFADKPKIIKPPGESSGEEDDEISCEVVKIGGTNYSQPNNVHVKPGLHNILYPNSIQYNVAKQILRDAGAKESEIGKEKFICAIKSYFMMASLKNLSQIYDGVSTLVLQELCTKLCSKININNIIKREPIEQASMEDMKRKMVETAMEGKKKRKKVEVSPNVLDKTSIHPENYELAEEIIKDACLNIAHVGQEQFCTAMKSFMKFTTFENLSSVYKTEIPILKQVLGALTEKTETDIRDENEKPLFRTTFKKFSDVVEGNELTGVISNVTYFGAFVDLGVGTSGLIHVSKMPENAITNNEVSRGQRVLVKVINVDPNRNRISLKWLKNLN